MKASRMHDNLSAYAKGVLGEAAVCDRLTDGGMELLERRFRSPFGEIDLVMLDGDVLAFVEVKLRTRGGTEAGQAAGDPAEAPPHGRRPPAATWARTRTCGPLRTLDVVTVTAEGVRHVPDAFSGCEW